MYRRVLRHLSQRRRRQLIGLALLMLVAAFAELLSLGALLPFLAVMADPSEALTYPVLQEAFKTLGWNAPENLRLPFAVLFSVAALAAAMVRLGLTWSTAKLTFGIGHDLGCKLYESTLYRPYRYHVAHNTSEVLGGLAKVDMIVVQSLMPVLQVFSAVVISSFIITALLMIDTTVALVAACGFGAIYLLISVTLRRRLKEGGRRNAVAQSERVRSMQEGLGGIRDVLIDGSQPEYVDKFRRIDRRMRKEQASANFLGQAPRYVIESVGMVLIAVLAYVLSRQAGGLAAALPTLGALALGAQKLMPLLQMIYLGWTRIQNSRVAMNDVLSLMEAREGDVRADNKGDPLDFEKAIVLKEISFRYRPDGPEVLRNLNLTIPKGARVGFIGATGSGKSTTLDLIMGLLDPTSGNLEVDGVGITPLTRRAWQSRIAHVPQAIYLSDASIAENIAFGVPKEQIDMVRVRDAARQAQIADFIERMSEGYHSIVGERGARLSGGQRQRIGIARALYKRAAVLVFDEATSALDAETEASVMSAIEALGGRMTVLMIAHRLTTVRNCDFIVQMERGELIYQGPFDERLHSAPARDAATS
jgi:ABC-type multidrug transport system fused ATPase/permease subunit